MEKIILPENVVHIITLLENAGYEAYVVGGCVRDSVMGFIPHDWDIATSAKPDEVTKIFADYKVIPTGIKHGTVTVMIEDDGYEITTFRVDGKYSDGRRPDDVEYAESLEEDLSRRDFTINAMAFNPRTGIIDDFGGIDDIRNKVIRCVGNPYERFKEDALRILRAIRFASTLGFELEVYTRNAMLELAYLIKKNVARERVCAEICKMFDQEIRTSNKTVQDFITCLSYVEPALKTADKPLISERLKRSSPHREIRLSILFDYDTEKTDWILSNLRFDNSTIRTVHQISEFGHQIYNKHGNYVDERVYAKHIMKLCGYENANHAADFAFYYSDDATEMQRINKLANTMFDIYINDECYQICDLDISGNDLIEIGFSGADIGDCLRTLLDDVICGKIENEHNSLISAAKEYKLELD